MKKIIIQILIISSILCLISCGDKNSITKNTIITSIQYRSGDSPVDEDGKFKWIKNDTHKNDLWKSSDKLILARGFNGPKDYWFKLQLPESNSNNDCLFIPMSFTSYQLILNNKILLERGAKFNSKKYHFNSSLWEIIQLEKKQSGQFIYFRAYSDFYYIGFLHNFIIGSEASIYKNIISRNSIKIFLGFLYIFLSLVSFLIYWGNKKRLIFVGFGIFTLSTGTYTIVVPEMSYLLFYQETLGLSL